MSEENGIVRQWSASNMEEGLDVVEEIFEAADVEEVFGEPVEAGDYIVIPAADVFVAGGLGMGFGSDPESETEEFGAGLGGGGTSSGRPVAAIVIGPNGVVVEPIIDVTKVGLAFISAMAGLVIAVNRMNRHG
ncbi:MAG: GerW family sporulation protein [Anaerolineae bacterium]